ncbi:hypothetical protein PISL3812_06530 [Talaromyces islandicus]|uniref:Inosine/uridine-preferring nucleoside hydrolase domain-containing protein n=1 Tax=Talaromyces islandicus TaxID=28573 RepID=A0A0U1M1U1_TALIS|nr:hypothetical protein PISL3812_06530 [Talaromyces islandicus]
MPSRHKIILDTDPVVGIPGTDADDPLALLLALGDSRLGCCWQSQPYSATLRRLLGHGEQPNFSMQQGGQTSPLLQAWRLGWMVLYNRS